jgi:hypothetical protein
MISLRPHVAARSPVSGAALPATKADACGREALIQTLGQRGSPYCHKRLLMQEADGNASAESAI